MVKRRRWLIAAVAASTAVMTGILVTAAMDSSESDAPADSLAAQQEDDDQDEAPEPGSDLPNLDCEDLGGQMMARMWEVDSPSASTPVEALEIRLDKTFTGVTVDDLSELGSFSSDHEQAYELVDSQQRRAVFFVNQEGGKWVADSAMMCEGWSVEHVAS